MVICCMIQGTQTPRVGGWEGRWEGGVSGRDHHPLYLWLIHVDVWQKPTQCCKTITLKLKINKFNYKKYKKLNMHIIELP